VQGFFVVGEFADELEDEGDVCGGRVSGVIGDVMRGRFE
jgi:hypothetical protein